MLNVHNKIKEKIKKYTESKIKNEISVFTISKNYIHYYFQICFTNNVQLKIISL